MSFIETELAQQWLQHTKYDIGVVEPGVEELIKGEVFGKLNRRYVITSWVDGDTTPELVIQVMGMLAAAWHIRKVASEEDGLTSYAEQLERRAYAICDGILDGDILLTDQTDNADTIIGGSADFFPTNASTDLYNQSKRSDGSTSEEGAAPLTATMGMQF